MNTTLQRADGTVSWLSIVMWRPQFHSLDFYEPALDIRRNQAGVISVAGIDMGGDSKEGGLSDWILGQRDLEIHNAAIDWTDEQRAAPVLQLRQVSMQLLNRGERHRFGLKAIPPKGVAGPLDVRGDMVGKSIKQLTGWRGRLYAQLDYTDIAAWRTWIPFPVEINRGTGAVRAWAVVRDQTLQELTADVAPIRAECPLILLGSSSGRLSIFATRLNTRFTLCPVIRVLSPAAAKSSLVNTAPSSICAAVSHSLTTAMTSGDR